MKHLLPLVSIFLFGTLVNAQWYFESAVISSHQGSHELENMRGGTATTTKLNAYKGFRDQSLGLGYLFSFRSLEQRMAQDYKPPLMRLGVGIGFEQMNLKTNAVINEVAHPNVYSMAQAHGRLGLYLAPALLYARKTDANGNRKPWLLLDLHGGFGINHYTSATQHYGNTLIDLKHPDVKFDDTFLSYFYGLGLQFALGKYTQLYSRCGIDNALNLTEYSDGKVMERYEIRKKKISIGLIFDLTAARKQRTTQKRELAALREAFANLTAPDNSDQAARINALEQTQEQQRQQIQALLADGKAPLATKTHAEGFDYLFEFTPIAFPLDSAVLDHDKFAVPLQKAADFLRKNPHFNLMVVGYADHTGATGYNKELSVQRALRVRDYLHVKHGLPLTSIKWIGAGETVRFSDDNTQKNRRTELLIIKPNK
jgi:outer membrane protein OmpA-like peptidoglycan-associated protein